MPNSRTSWGPNFTVSPSTIWNRLSAPNHSVVIGLRVSYGDQYEGKKTAPAASSSLGLDMPRPNPRSASPPRIVQPREKLTALPTENIQIIVFDSSDGFVV